MLERAPSDALSDVVCDVCGIHVQVALAAEIALAIRVAAITRSDVREALYERRTLVKTPSHRKTLHIHAAADIALWMAAHRAYPFWRDASALARYGLTPDSAEAIMAAIADALDGRCLTGDELADAVAARVGPWAVEETDVITWGGRRSVRWAPLITPAAYTGRLCYGPKRGNRVTFVRPDQWLGASPQLDPQASLVEVLRRYLAAYGPARAADFAQWFGVPEEIARAPLEELAWEVVEVEVEGLRMYRLAAAFGEPSGVRSVRLAPEFDCYVVGAAPPGKAREHVVPPAFRTRVFDRGAGPYPVVLANGVAVGTWSRSRRGKTLSVHVDPFEPLRRTTERALGAEAARLAAFLETDVELST